MRKAFKWLGIGGALVTAGLIVMGFRGLGVATATYGLDQRVVTELPDSVDLAEGRRLASIYGCHGCHGPDLSGRVFIDAPPFLVVARNLTGGRGGIAGEYRSPGDWDRAIRYRIRPDGRGLLPMMPSENYHRMSDDDVARIIAYIQSVPPVDRELPDTKVRWMGLPIAGAGVLHPERGWPDAPGGPTPPPGPTAEYGAYLALLTCVECHGEDLHGGPTPGGGPKAPSLLPAGAWPAGAFFTAMREGRVPDGRRMAEEMPSEYFRLMTDTELTALHEYLATLAPPSAGERE